MTSLKESLVNHEERIKQLECHDGEVMRKVSTILEVRLPAIEQSISSLSVKITTMSVLNVGAIIVGVIVSKLLNV